MKKNLAGMKAGAERYTYGTLLEGAWKINITIFLRIIKQKNKNVQKEITY